MPILTPATGDVVVLDDERFAALRDGLVAVVLEGMDPDVRGEREAA